MSDFKLPDLSGHGTLAAKLDAIHAFIRESSPALMGAVDAFIDELREGKAGARAPQIGDVMPEFVLANGAGGVGSLSGYLANGPVIISFFRGRWCPFCLETKRAHDRARDEAAQAGVTLVGVTPERPSHFVGDAENASIDVLCDVDNGYALSLNLVIFLHDGIAKVYRDLGIDPSAQQVGASWFIPLSASFLVGQDGVVRARHIDPDWRNRLPLEDFLTTAKTAYAASAATP